MVVASRAKASDRAALLKKLFPLIKKHYKVQTAKGGKPVLETMLFAICLEDSTVEQAEASFKKLFAEFPDLNEVRVSTVAEVERAFIGQTASEWRAFRVISVLKFVFDKTYSFEFESLRKKTLDLATKQLAKIKELSPFVRDYTLHEVTGSHLIPIDQSLSRLLLWLGLVPPNQSFEQIGELMRGAVRKAEVESFTSTLRSLATDPVLQVAFDHTKYPVPEAGHELETTIDRLTNLFKNGVEKPPKAGAKVAPPKSAAAKTPVKKKEASKKGVTNSAPTDKTDDRSRKKSASLVNRPAKKTALPRKPVKKVR